MFNWEEYEALRALNPPPRMPTPDGSLFVGDKGMLTTGTYGEQTRLIPAEKMRDYRMPEPLLTRSRATCAISCGHAKAATRRARTSK